MATLVLIGAPCMAGAETQAPAAPVANTAPAKKVTLTIGADIVSAYMFRGIFQEDKGAIIQPAIDIGVSLGRGVSLNFGNWDSLHSSSASGTFYESDYYASLTATAGKWKPGALFTSYTSPADRFVTVHELALVLSYDDSGRAVPMSPKFVIARELSGQADAGTNKGTYFEFGTRTTFKLAEGKTPVNLIVPVKLGLSLKDYYELPGTDNAFGFFDVGALLSVPVSLSKGTLEFHAGVDLLTLGSNMKARNGGDKTKPVLLVGFTYVY